MKIDKIVIATQNSSKKDHYARIFSEIAKEVTSLKDLGILDKPEETDQ